MRIFNRKVSAFSLAEMMVVMLIVAIVLAATAPMITRKVSRERSDKVFATFNDDPNYVAEYIGGKYSRIYMKAEDNGYVGIKAANDSKKLPNNSVLFGWNKYSTDHPGVVGIGFDTENGAEDSVAIGHGVKATILRSIVIGPYAEAKSDRFNPTDTVAVGYKAKATSDKGIAIGYQAEAVNGLYNKIPGVIAIGYNTKAQGDYAMAIGYGAQGLAVPGVSSPYYSIAMGHGAKVTASNAIAIGRDAKAKGSSINSDGAVAIGYGADAVIGIAIGYNAKADSENIAIGRNTRFVGASNSMAIGHGAKVERDSSLSSGYTVTNATAIGYNAKATFSNTVVLGDEKATVYIPGNLVVGKVTLVGASSVADNEPYPFFYRPTLTRSNDKEAKVKLFTPLNGVDDYKGDIDPGKVADGAQVFYYYNGAYNRGVKVGPYRINEPFHGGYGDNQKVCIQEVSGNFTWTFKSGGSCSDIRLKNVGEEYTGGLEELSKLKFYHFTFKKDETKTPHVGVMAQDLQKVFPDAVKPDADGYLTIRWDEMFYAALNAIKELNNKVTAISEKLKTVTEDIVSLKNITQKHQETIDAQAKLIDEQQAELKDLTKRIEKLERSKK